MRLYEEHGQQIRADSQRLDRHIAELEAEKGQAVQAFKLSTTPEMRAALEEDVTRIEADIAAAKLRQVGMEVNEGEARAYARDLAAIASAPLTMLTHAESIKAQRRRFAIVFEDFPTLTEIEARTAKLTEIFRGFCENEDPQGHCVRPPRLTWNQLCKDIERYKRFDEERSDASSWLDGGAPVGNAPSTR
jgi:hypothetical protein